MPPALLLAARRLTQAIGCVGMVVLLGNVALQMFDIACRWLLGAPQSWVADVYEVSLPVAIAACFPATVMERGMIAVGFLGGALGAGARRGLDLFGGLALLAVLGVVTWQTLGYAAETFATGRTSFLLGLPMAPTWFTVTLFFALASLIQLLVLLGLPPAGADRSRSEAL